MKQKSEKRGEHKLAHHYRERGRVPLKKK